MAQDPIVYGKYQLLELLARGGMGEVFKARSYGVEGFEKTLVIKRILPELSKNPRFVEMFIDEAKVAVTLTHANIAQVFDLGFVDGTYFIAMEYVPGYDLFTVLRWGQKLDRLMPPELAVYVVSELAKGLDYAHRRRDSELRPLGIVHRDVSPENVLLSYEGEVKITDFGIARSRSSIHRMAQLPPGKFAYLAPEQAREQEVDARADLFALGTILYEALTGVRPFQASTPLGTLERARRGDAPPMIDVKPGIAQELSDIVTHAMSPNRSERYATAGELYEDLIQFLYASGRRVGAHDLARFLEETAALAADPAPAEQFDRLSAIEEVFTDSTGKRASLGVTPLSMPSRSSVSSIPPSSAVGLPPRSEWREVTALAVQGVARDEMLTLGARYGGEACLGHADDITLIVFGLGDADGHDAQTAARCALRARQTCSETLTRAVVHSGRLLIDSEGKPRAHSAVDTLRSDTLRWLARTGPSSVGASLAAAKLLRGRFELAPAQGDAPRIVERERRADEGVGKFVGRRDELRKLGETLARANRGRARVIGIKGDAGSGKSRLLLEASRRLRQAGHDVGFYLATCSPQGRAVPFSAIHELLRAVLGVEELEPEARLREKVDRLKLLGLPPSQRDAVARVLGLSVPGASGMGAATLESAILRISYKLAQDKLTVFAWDSAELMDAQSRSLLGRLLADPPEARVVTMFAYRPSDPGPWVTSPTFTEVVISPLSTEDLGRLVRHRLLATQVPDDLVHDISIKTGGNPLYIEELVTAMREGGKLDVHDGIVTKSSDSTSLELPRTLRGLVASRVGRLAQSHRLILQVAVTFGPRFAPELVARAAGQDEPNVRTALSVLEERGIVRALSPSEYTFAHELVREVLYDGIALDERPLLHAAVARAIETLRPAELDAVVDRLAHHHREAGQREEAVSYLVRSAQRCEAEHALEAAIDAYAQAIDLLSLATKPDRTHVLQLYTRIGDLGMRSRVAEAVADRMGAALELAETLGREEFVARFAMMRGRLLNKASRFQEGRLWLERAEAVARRRGDRGLERDIALACAEAHARNGEYTSVIELGRRALELAQMTDDVTAQVRCLLLMAPAYAAIGEGEVALSALRDAQELTGDPPDRMVEVELYKVRSLVFHQLGDQEGMIDSARRSLDLAREYGFSYEVAVNAHNLGEFYLRTGDDKKAFSSLRMGYEVATEHGFARLAMLNVCLLGFLDAMRFGSEQGKARMVQAVQYAEARGYTWDLIGEKYLLAIVEQKLGRPEAALAALRDVIGLAERHGHVRIRDDAEQGLRAVAAGRPIALPR